MGLIVFDLYRRWKFGAEGIKSHSTIGCYVETLLWGEQSDILECRGSETSRGYRFGGQVGSRGQNCWPGKGESEQGPAAHDPHRGGIGDLGHGYAEGTAATKDVARPCAD